MPKGFHSHSQAFLRDIALAHCSSEIDMLLHQITTAFVLFFSIPLALTGQENPRHRPN